MLLEAGSSSLKVEISDNKCRCWLVSGTSEAELFLGEQGTRSFASRLLDALRAQQPCLGTLAGAEVRYAGAMEPWQYCFYTAVLPADATTLVFVEDAKETPPHVIAKLILRQEDVDSWLIKLVALKHASGQA